MKTDCALLALFAAAAVRLAAAETLTADTAVFQQADAASPVITRLAKGATVDFVGEAPAGWRRVEIAGTFEAFVHTRDITKGLDVREGANLLTAPAKGAPVLTTAQKDDKSEIVGLRGDYCQVKVTKKLQGFIAGTEIANRPSKPLVATPAAPAAPAPAPTTTIGKPIAATNTADLPRLFSGTLVVARRPLINPNPPYDYQLSDLSGRRFAYVDTKRLVLTDRIENLVDKIVTVTGTVRNTVDGKDLVVVAESIQVK
ncbi:MAG: hypothetical protein C0502_01380 [Opitutus sp.]|nr:hypothetical protein [Opitutus sp.]